MFDVPYLKKPNRFYERQAMKKQPPSKELCLALAQFYWEDRNPKLSWDYLFCWGFYEMYLEGWQG